MIELISWIDASKHTPKVGDSVLLLTDSGFVGEGYLSSKGIFQFTTGVPAMTVAMWAACPKGPEPALTAGTV